MSLPLVSDIKISWTHSPSLSQRVQCAVNKRLPMELLLELCSIEVVV